MATLNFLPTEQIRSRVVTTAGNRLKVFTALLGVACLTVGIGGTALVLFKNNELSQLKDRQATLRAQVLAQESSEQTLVLLRDRLSKFKAIETKYPSNKRFLEEKKVLDALPVGIELKQLGLSADASTFAVLASDSGAFAAFVGQMQQSTLANSTIDSFLYNSINGFQINLIVQ